LDRRLGGPQSRSGHSGGEEKNSQPLPGLELIVGYVIIAWCLVKHRDNFSFTFYHDLSMAKEHKSQVSENIVL
jgi:hypothetical protein